MGCNLWTSTLCLYDMKQSRIICSIEILSGVIGWIVIRGSGHELYVFTPFLTDENLN